MEFLDHDKTLAVLVSAGFTHEQSSPSEGAPDDAAGILRFGCSADAERAVIAIGGSGDEGGVDFRLAAETGELCARLDDLLHALHAQEVLVIPAGPWRATLDTVAFALAENEAWQDVDAEASLHQHTHDPLTFPPDQRSTLLALVNTVIDAGGGEEADLSLLAADVGALVEVVASGFLRVTLVNAGLAESVAERLGAEPA